MSISTKWLVADDNGVVHQPWIRKCVGGYEFGDASPVYETEREAVLAWALAEKISVAEVVAPYTLSIKAQCAKAIDDLWERVRLMGDVEGGNGTGGTVRFVVDDSGGFDEETWTADQCDDALEGIRLAISAIDLMDAREEDE